MAVSKYIFTVKYPVVIEFLRLAIFMLFRHLHLNRGLFNPFPSGRYVHTHMTNGALSISPTNTNIQSKLQAQSKKAFPVLLIHWAGLKRLTSHDGERISGRGLQSPPSPTSSLTATHGAGRRVSRWHNCRSSFTFSFRRRRGVAGRARRAVSGPERRAGPPGVLSRPERTPDVWHAPLSRLPTALSCRRAQSGRLSPTVQQVRARDGEISGLVVNWDCW